MEKPSLERKTQKESMLNRLYFMHNTEHLEALELGKYGRALYHTKCNITYPSLFYYTAEVRLGHTGGKDAKFAKFRCNL